MGKEKRMALQGKKQREVRRNESHSRFSQVLQMRVFQMPDCYCDYNCPKTKELESTKCLESLLKLVG